MFCTGDFYTWIPESDRDRQALMDVLSVMYYATSIDLRSYRNGDYGDRGNFATWNLPRQFRYLLHPIQENPRFQVWTIDTEDQTLTIEQYHATIVLPIEHHSTGSENGGYRVTVLLRSIAPERFTVFEDNSIFIDGVPISASVTQHGRLETGFVRTPWDSMPTPVVYADHRQFELSAFCERRLYDGGCLTVFRVEQRSYLRPAYRYAAMGRLMENPELQRHLEEAAQRRMEQEYRAFEWYRTRQLFRSRSLENSPTVREHVEQSRQEYDSLQRRLAAHVDASTLPKHYQAFIDEYGYTEPFYQEHQWWAFPRDGVMPVVIAEAMKLHER